MNRIGKISAINEAAAPVQWAQERARLIGARLRKVSMDAAAPSTGLLILNANGAGLFSSALLGWRNTARIRQASGPVLLVQSKPQRAYRRVLIATDFSEASLAAAKAAIAITPAAEVVVAHVFQLAESGLMLEQGLASKIVRSYRQKAREVAKQKLDEFVQALDMPVRPGRAVLYGTPQRIVPHYAANIGADLVVLGRRRRSLVGSLFAPGLRRCLAPLKLDILLCAADERGQA